jgi:CheY-like chemotaxis protein
MADREILVVDDSEDIRETLRGILAEEGYRVAVARDGAAALSHLGAGRLPDLILLDWWMPVVDGATFCAMRRRVPSLAAIPLVVMTAALDIEVDTREVVAILQKPMDLDDVLATVERHAGSRRQSAAIATED